MKKLLKFLCLCLMLFAFFWCGTLYANRKTLNEDLIRLHVVANSDSQEDQQLKLQLRDALVEKLQAVMQNLPDAQTAKAYIQEHLQQLQELANRVLEQLGSGYTAKVTFEKETFDTRQYDTFRLPAGSYDSLRITIGAGEGENWWCVVFPTLCLPATTEEFADAAVGAGFSRELTQSLQTEGFHLRFFLLDCLGRVENFFRSL